MRKIRRGIVLVVVLVVIAILSLAGYGFTEWMQTEQMAAVMVGRKIQAEHLAWSGVEAVKVFLALPPETRDAQGGLIDNAGRFRGLIVIPSDDPKDRGRVTILSPLQSQGFGTGQMRYGLEDESTRINLNALPIIDAASPGAGREALMRLPMMTVDIADSILDWIDEDDNPREYGAERSYYSGLNPPYSPTNGPLESIEELLLVRGMLPELLLGDDSARSHGASLTFTGNAALNSSATTSGTTESTTNLSSNYIGDTAIPPGGWASLFTLASAETNLDSAGNQRIDLNASDMKLLYADLSGAFGEEWAAFIIAYRQFGPYNPSANNNNTTGNTGGQQPNQNNNQGGGNTGGSNTGGNQPMEVGGTTGGNNAGGNTNTGGNTQPGGTIGNTNSNQASNTGGAATGGGTTGTGAPTTGQTATTQIVDPNPLQGETASAGQLDLTRAGSTKLSSVLDLIGVRVQVQIQGQNQQPQNVILKAAFPNLPGIMQTYLPKLTDKVAVNTAKTLPGRININKAPRAVLRAIPGITDEMVDDIIATRVDNAAYDDPDWQHETWLLGQGIVTLDEMKRLLPFVTTRGEVYRFQSVGFFDSGSPAARIEAVIDATESAPRLVSWRELTPLGKGFPAGTLGAAAQ